MSGIDNNATDANLWCQIWGIILLPVLGEEKLSYAYNLSPNYCTFKSSGKHHEPGKRT